MNNQVRKKNFLNFLQSQTVKSLATAFAATLPIIALPLKSEALTFNFEFDNSPDSVIDPNNIVGTGTFSFDGDLGDGTFALADLPNYEFFFDFGGDTFTNADITTPLDELLAIISTSENDRFLKFSNTGSVSGPFRGSIDFQNSANSSNTALSFQPPGGNFDLYFTSSNFGTYRGSIEVDDDVQPVPEPASVLGLLAFGAVGGSMLKRKQNY